MIQNLKDVGYAGLRITLKTDGEVSMKALKNQIALKRESATGITNSPVRESKANGAMEAAIRSWKGQTRTIRLYREHRLKMKIEYGHPVLTWLTYLSVEVINKLRARNGRNAYELMTGHRGEHLVIGLGEKYWDSSQRTRITQLIMIQGGSKHSSWELRLAESLTWWQMKAGYARLQTSGDCRMRMHTMTSC